MAEASAFRRVRSGRRPSGVRVLAGFLVLLATALPAACSRPQARPGAAAGEGAALRAAVSAPLYRLERVAGMPSSYRAYLGESMYTISQTSPYRVVRSLLTGEDPATLATIPCTERPAFTAAVASDLILACNGGPDKQVLLISVDDGQRAILFQHSGPLPVMAFGFRAGRWIYWWAQPWTEGGDFGAWGLVDGHGRPAPEAVRRQFAEVERAGEVWNDLEGHFFIVVDGMLEEWAGDRFSPVGPVGSQRLEAVGDGRVIVSTVQSLPDDIISTYTLETLNPLRQVVSWTVHGVQVVGMTYTISVAPGLVELDFPLQHKHYALKDVIGQPQSANGQVYFRSSRGYERLVITAPGMNAMTDGFWR